jgi:hypothetical protein
MPQAPIDEGFEGCGSVRVSFSPSATPTNFPPLDDADGRYFLVDRADPSLPLKFVLTHTLASDEYDSFIVSNNITGTFEEYRTEGGESGVFPVPVDETYHIPSYGHGPYGRNATRSINEDYPNDGFRHFVLRTFYAKPIPTWDYDDDGNLVEVMVERVCCEVEVSTSARTLYGTNEAGNIYLDTNTTGTVTRITTLDGRSINIDTAEVSDGWAIIIYEVYEWGDSELIRYSFDADPSPIAVNCLDSICDNDCVPIYDADDNVICVCRDADFNETDDYEYQPYEHNQTRPRYQEYTP